jgi:hypothetical protein
MLRRWIVLSGVLALAACQRGNLAVPIGDPDKSRIDPQLTGVWQVIGAIEDEADEAQPEAPDSADDEGSVSFVIVAPYDKRTWIVRQVWLNAKKPPPADIMELDGWIGSPMHEVSVCNAMKVWIARLGGVDFAVAEPQFSLSEEHEFKQDEWMVFRLERHGRDRVTLAPLDEGFKTDETGPELGKITSQREAERIIRKNAKNPVLYGGKLGEEILPHWELRRLPSDAYDELWQAMAGSESTFGWCVK